MVKQEDKRISKDRINQGEEECPAEASRIGPSTRTKFTLLGWGSELEMGLAQNHIA